jgi:signal transduction histidine kinase
MTLRRRFLVTSVLVSVPVAFALYSGVQWLRTRDMAMALQRVVTSQVNDGVRAQCESDPQWFLAGPREPRPRPEERARPDADVYLPRPSTDPLPFEIYAYDEEFGADSTAGPRFPPDLKRVLRSTSQSAIVPFVTSEGTGLQMAVLTGWKGSACAVLLARLRPVPHETIDHALVLGSIFVAVLAAAFLVSVETEGRIRRVSDAARDSVRANYSGAAIVTGRDEIGSVAAAFNEACVEIRRRVADVKDREEALRRFTANVSEDVVASLGVLEARLGLLDRTASLSPEARVEVREAIREAHDTGAKLQNLAASATLRLSSESPAREQVDLAGLTARVVERHQVLARAAEVTLAAGAPHPPVIVLGDAVLLERTISNLIDNAIRYNRAGGRVTVRLGAGAGRFSLRVIDDGPGVSEEALSRLTAIRRFRGDEARTQQPGGLGLGLAIVREVGDRLKLQWTFRRVAAGGFEAELGGETIATSDN